MTAQPRSPGQTPPRVIATHRRAYRDYHILEKMEGGLELRGTEVKSLREGRVSLAGSFGRVEHGEVFLHQLRIEPYPHAGAYNHDPLRPKRVLLRREQIRRLIGQVTTRGCTLIPLRLLWVRGWAKVELALCRGKHAEDKRETLRRRAADREAERALAAAQKRKA